MTVCGVRYEVVERQRAAGQINDAMAEGMELAAAAEGASARCAALEGALAELKAEGLLHPEAPTPSLAGS